MTQNVFVEANHRAVAEQIVRPLFFLHRRLNEQVIAFLFALFGNFRHLRIVLARTQQVQHMLSAGQVQRFIAGDQTDNFGVTFHQLALGESERTGEADVEADGFQRVNAHQADIELLLQFAQVNGDGFAVHVMRPFAK